MHAEYAVANGISHSNGTQNDHGLGVKAAAIGINGFGRIGRIVLRLSLRRADVHVVAINHTCASVDDLIYLIRHDSTHGLLGRDVDIRKVSDHELAIDGRRVVLRSTRIISELDWASLGVDCVIESTGKFTKAALATQHITTAGAKRVIISAPGSDSPTFVYGVNTSQYRRASDNAVISAASCTTNCVTPVLKVINDTLGVKHASLTTIHAATQSQHVLDGHSKKSRRLGRSIFNNMIPTTTGASKAIAAVLPELENKVNGISIRVPIANVSLVDLTIATERPSTLDALLGHFRSASAAEMAGVLTVSDEDLVSSDLVGSTFSCVVDAGASIQLNPQFFKICAWYDNEAAYGMRLLDLVTLMERSYEQNI